MSIKKVRLCNICLFLLILLPIYQDSPLSQWLGAAGYSLLMPVSLIFYVMYVFLTSKSPQNEYLRRIYRLGIWMSIISFFAILIWIILGNSITVVGEYLPVKAVKVILQYFSYPAYIALLLICVRKTGMRALKKYVFVVLVIMTVICLFEQSQIPYAFQFLHYIGQFPYYRTRLLTLEASTTSMLIYVYVGITAFYCLESKRKMLSIIALVCTAILFYTSGSKTLLASIAITIVIFIFLAFKKLDRRKIIYLFIAAIAVVLFAEFILPSLSSSFNNDISEYTSVVTRLYTSVIGLMIGVVFPMGVGGAVYLGVFQKALSDYLFIFDKITIKLNLSEIISLATRNTDTALTVKSGIFHFNMYWGILGTIYLFGGFTKLSKKISNSGLKYNEIILALFWTAVFLLIFSSNFSFEFWLLFTFLMCLEEGSRGIINA